MHHLAVASPSPAVVTTLDSLWRALVAGRLVVRATEQVDGRSHIVLTRSETGAPMPSAGARLLERIFAGESQKSLALGLGVTVGTIASTAAEALHATGSRQLVSKAPIVLVMAAMAATGLEQQAPRLELADAAELRLSVETPGIDLQDRLSPAEHAVALLAIDGWSHAEISQLRRSSRRTVANQLAAVFQKTHSSGRAELRARAIREQAARQARVGRARIVALPTAVRPAPSAPCAAHG